MIVVSSKLRIGVRPSQRRDAAARRRSARCSSPRKAARVEPGAGSSRGLGGERRRRARYRRPACRSRAATAAHRAARRDRIEPLRRIGGAERARQPARAPPARPPRCRRRRAAAPPCASRHAAGRRCRPACGRACGAAPCRPHPGRCRRARRRRAPRTARRGPRGRSTMRGRRAASARMPSSAISEMTGLGPGRRAPRPRARSR